MVRIKDTLSIVGGRDSAHGSERARSIGSQSAVLEEGHSISSNDINS